MIRVLWSNRLEALADALADDLDRGRAGCPEDVLALRRRIVVPNRIVQHWLRQRLLLDSGGRRVLANLDFPLLHVFINDGLFRLTHPDGELRDPEAHPFSRDAMAWRIFRLLGEFLPEAPAWRPLRDALRRPGRGGRDPRDAARRYQLATRLAALFDEYMVYRPEMLLGWQAGHDGGLEPDLAWQPALWRSLTEGFWRDRSYLAAFLRLREPGLAARTGLDRDCRLRLFGVAMLPRVYLHFLEQIGRDLPVDIYTLNPSPEDWFAAPPPDPAALAALEARPESEEDLRFGSGNAFLSRLGRGNREFLLELLDRTGGQAEADARFVPPCRDNLLGALHARLFRNRAEADPPAARREAELPLAERSVLLQVCHNPMREVEVLRDHLLRWFTEDPGLQPRDVQVHVTDLKRYAPLIQAVFAAPQREASDTIPFAIADRVAAGESAAAAAFLRLLELADSRFPAPDILDLLRCGALREVFGIAEEQLDMLQEWIRDAGIRWGRAREHRTRAVGVDFEDYTTWRRGMQRLLLGYAYGRGGGRTAGTSGRPLPCDCADGGDAPLLGRLALLFDQLDALAERCAVPRPPEQWAALLDDALTLFFAETNANYGEIGQLRAAVASLRKSAGAAACDAPFDLPVARLFLQARLQDVLGGDTLGGNAVVFSALRPGASLPRRIIGLLGLTDGVFPRIDNRPAYDLLRRERRFGDRSLRQEDRMSFLEAVLAARERLYLSYTGFTADNSPAPPAVVLAELLEELDRAAGLPRGAAPEQRALPPVFHRLQPHHPLYFAPGAGCSEAQPLFSFSRGACATARALQERRQAALREMEGGSAAKGQSETMRRQPVCVHAGPDQQSAAPQDADGAGATTLDLEMAIRFCQHPVRAFFNETLGVYLEPPAKETLDDQEAFSPEGLEQHAIHTAILDTLLDDPDAPSDPLRRELLENGLLPLGPAGARWFESRWDEMRAWLQGEPPELGLPLAAAAELQRAAGFGAPRCTLDLVEGLLLAGRPTVAQGPKGPFALEFRYVKRKPGDYMGSGFRHYYSCWLRHLFGCAAGQPSERFFVCRDDRTPWRTARFPALPTEEALDAWRKTARIRRAGLADPLPFALATSAAFAAAWHGNADAAAPERLAAALDGARLAWQRADGIHDRDQERDDPYLRAAFGSVGPCADPDRFAELALALLPSTLF